MGSFWSYLRANLNFYRLHLLAFLCIPLLGATILWASNGKFPVKFIDSLYICVSGATGTGLITVDLSGLTIWQEVVLVILEIVGNQAFVAWFVVIIRRWYFVRNLRHIVSTEMERTQATGQNPVGVHPTLQRIRSILARAKAEKEKSTRLRSGADIPQSSHVDSPRLEQPHHSRAGLRADMIRRRLDIAPQPIDPMGTYAAPVSQERSTEVGGVDLMGTTASRRSRRSSTIPAPKKLNKEDDFGGFPGVQDVVGSLSRKLFPGLRHQLKRTLTVPRTETLVPQTTADVAPISVGPVKRVPYLSFSATVNRNSTFRGLTAENIEELGGVEYRALCSLLWIIPVYYIGLLAISFVVTAPYMSLSRWEENYHPPLQHKDINPVWFSAFQVVGAWANTGMSLVDQNMVPFQTAYPMIIFIVICVLAGNTCLVRISTWLLTKLPGRSRMKASLHFLLDHPRRCTIYLFPSRQTWLLLGLMMALNIVNLIGYLVLDIGNPVTENLPFGTKFIDAVLDAAACRNAGYQPIPMSSLYPAVQVLSVVMMYIAIYPIAMSVRSTNVYEARSLGIYESDDDEDEINDDAHWDRPSESRVEIWGRYLIRHARRQLSFDMWWLAISLLLLCIIERANLTNQNKLSYFNVFALVFELVSAYGTVGLSLGVPGFNFSLSGDMHTLSKLIICAVMIRGRHRGLPVALDRAVLMPSEFLDVQPDKTPPEIEAREKGTPGDAEVAPFPQMSYNPDELEAKMKLRTRTISLILEERRDPTKEAGPPPWLGGHLPEETNDSFAEGSGTSAHRV
ncbi:TrkH-domain-containing protein [Trametes meyenii]|nr:TrkH-domain-containing protein [Trametes meyenii]